MKILDTAKDQIDNIPSLYKRLLGIISSNFLLGIGKAKQANFWINTVLSMPKKRDSKESDLLVRTMQIIILNESKEKSLAHSRMIAFQKKLERQKELTTEWKAVKSVLYRLVQTINAREEIELSKEVLDSPNLQKIVALCYPFEIELYFKAKTQKTSMFNLKFPTNL